MPFIGPPQLQFSTGYRRHHILARTPTPDLYIQTQLVLTDSSRFGMPIRRVTRILFSLCSDLETDVIGESVQRGFDADIKLIERRQLLLW